jgi:hypothetical protein
MTSRGIPRKSNRLFRITSALFGIVFGGAAMWLFATSRAPVVAWILAGAAAFAIVDAVIGWRRSRE